jgi:predicted permease
MNDPRLVLRQAARTPGFIAAAVLTLSLGVGANTAIFSMVNAFVRPLPVPAAEQIVVIANVDPDDETGFRYRFSFPALQDFRARATEVLSDVFGYDIRIGGLGVDGRTTPFSYQIVTGNAFHALRLSPAAGRLFAPGEGEHVKSEAVIVLGHEYWQRHFGGDPAVVGRVVQFEGRPVRIVGVAPEGFRGLVDSAVMDGYVPMDLVPRFGRYEADIFTDRASQPLTLMARMRPGVSVAQAQAVVDVVIAQLAREHPATDAGRRARVMLEPDARPVPLEGLSSLLPVVRLLLFVLSSVVLLIACLNVANLLLVRATVREREMAVRAALGSGRWRLIRLLLTESSLLALAGTTVGVALAQIFNWWFISSIDLGTDLAFRFEARFDWRVFANTAIIAVATGLVVGVLPARRLSRPNLASLLHDGGRSGSSGAGRQRVRHALVMAQIAGSLVLLIVAGLCVRNLRAAQQVDLGFAIDRVLTARLNTTNIGMDPKRSVAFYDELDRRLRNLPGVESTSQSFSLPLGWIFGGYQAHPEERPPADGRRDSPPIGANTVTPEYLDTMGIPLVSGRSFTSADTLDSKRVVIVNETLTERFWPGENPIGRRIILAEIQGDPWEVVGVAKTTKYLAVFEHALPYMYLPQAQNPGTLRVIEIRTTLPFSGMAALVERTVAELEPELPIADMRPLQAIVAGNLGFVLFRVGAWQASATGLLGLALALIGIYGLVSYQTAQRGREIGIRVALGAEPADVRRLVMRQGTWLIAGGLTVGLALTFTITTALGRVLVLVDATDPMTFASVTCLLAAAALAACYFPARRATGIAPVEALRHE